MCACQKYCMRTTGRYHDIYIIYIHISFKYNIEKATATVLFIPILTLRICDIIIPCSFVRAYLYKRFYYLPVMIFSIFIVFPTRILIYRPRPPGDPLSLNRGIINYARLPNRVAAATGCERSYSAVYFILLYHPLVAATIGRFYKINIL